MKEVKPIGELCVVVESPKKNLTEKEKQIMHKATKMMAERLKKVFK